MKGDKMLIPCILSFVLGLVVAVVVTALLYEDDEE